MVIDKTCCARLLLDGTYNGDRVYWDHERYQSHQWVEGETCCPTLAAQCKRVTCHCRATRWVQR